jgi:hypothetical protein
MKCKKHFARAMALLPLLLCLLAAGAAALRVSQPDGEYAVSLTMTGGSGKASVVSPTNMYIKNGVPTVKLQWSSSYYDYMLVDGKKYLNENPDGYSTFTVPILAFDREMDVVADTTAMGAPHEVSYKLTFYTDSISDVATLPQVGTRRVVVVSLVLIAVGGVADHFVRKRRDNDYTGRKAAKHGGK